MAASSVQRSACKCAKSLDKTATHSIKLCMVGAVRTKEKCPRCGGKFEGKPLRCPFCLTIPRRYFVDFSWPGQGQIKLYSDQQGYPLDSWDRAVRLLTAIRYEIDQGKFDPKDYIKKTIRFLKFENYAQSWLERREQDHIRQHITKSYLTELQAYVNKYFIPFFGKENLRDIRSGDIEDFYLWLPPHLSQKTVRNILGVLHKLFADAYRRQDILKIPNFPTIEKNEPVTRWLDEEEQRLVLSKMKDQVRRAFYLFLMKQGCRPGEARALRWEDINLKENLVIIRASFDREQYKPFTKERDVRYLPLHPEVKKALLEIPRQLSGWVFTYKGKPLTQWMASAYWRRAAKKAGVNVSCYEGTRHSLASQAINQGVSERIIGDFLGHKTLTSTRRYAKVQTETLKQVWGILEKNDIPKLSPKKKH
ncbi:MAG: tyrosine-type recombinase/integrase [Candidatus Jordarchaeaceae archaeon]